MRTLQILYAVSLLLLSSFSWSQDPVLGQWNTIDDDTGEVKSLVTLSLDVDGTLMGVISKVLKDNPGDGLCHHCEGDRKDQLIEGMTFMWGFKQAADGEWEEGQLLDPESGDVYSGSIEIADDSALLNVRGYIGISLFGRSQTWNRVVVK
jgi:uncharacterized protein (DUF2147 family)